MKKIDFAILAPVPKEHLVSALPLGDAKVYVSFGSKKWELFREVDKLRAGQDVPVLIYASHEADEAKLSFKVTWSGWYVGHVQDSDSKLEDESTGRRPPTTANHPGDLPSAWPVFWRVRHLGRLPEKLHIQLKSLGIYKPKYWSMKAPPLGPEIVARPSWI